MTEACGHCCARIENLGVRLGGAQVLEGVRLHLNCRELLAVIGPNGAGKTTLMRALLGEVPYTGTLQFKIGGEMRSRPRMGYVPQTLNLETDSPISVLDMMVSATSRRSLWLGVSRKTRKTLEEGLAAVSAAHLLKKKIGSLSGGELQRVLLAMAMIPRPDVLLLDEPVSGVDVNGLSLFYSIVSRLKTENDISIIMATHDLAGIAPYADRMILLNRTIVAEGTPREVLSDRKLLETFGPSLWNVSKWETGCTHA
ncbi:MAG: metal ABC transporter ATP-binding protein [Candidatus Omnitrophota bacterium]